MGSIMSSRSLPDSAFPSNGTDDTSRSNLSWTAVIHKRSSIQVGDLANLTNYSSSLATLDQHNVVIVTHAPQQRDYGSQQLNGLVIPGLQVVGLNGRCIVGQPASRVRAQLEELDASKERIVLVLYGIVAQASRPWHGALSSLARTKKQAAGISFSIDPQTLLISIARVHRNGFFGQSGTLEPGLVTTNVNGHLVSLERERSQSDEKETARRSASPSQTKANKKIHKSVIRRLQRIMADRLVYGCRLPNAEKHAVGKQIYVHMKLHGN